MKTKLLMAAAMIGASSAAFASVTLNFNAAFLGGVSAGLSNAGGTPTNGLFYGIIIDSNNNGLSASPYDNVTKALNGQFILSVSSVATDDILVFAGDLTSNTSAFSEGDFFTPGGNGGITSIAGLNLGGTIGTGDKFYVVWFDGNTVGQLTDPSFVLPADGAFTDYDAPFVGVDPNRRAGLAYQGTSGTSTGPAITFVPEPSAALLGALGALGLLRRRRI